MDTNKVIKELISLEILYRNRFRSNKNITDKAFFRGKAIATREAIFLLRK